MQVLEPLPHVLGVEFLPVQRQAPTVFNHLFGDENRGVRAERQSNCIAGSTVERGGLTVQVHVNHCKKSILIEFRDDDFFDFGA